MTTTQNRAKSFDPAHLWTALWCAVVFVAIWSRPPLPVDETRYLSVAWEMWQRGDYLVPFINGEPYSHKPPLLFWLMQAGWVVFGVNDWWPRMVAPLFGLASLFLTCRLAYLLWPDAEEVAQTAPLLLMGCVFWMLFTTVTMFDMMFAGLTLVALIGVVTAWRNGGWRGWAVCALGIGVGILAKGPAILIHVLPVALTAPFWARGTWSGHDPALPGGGWKRWYGGLGLAILGAAAIGLVWAIPAAIYGGPVYGHAIFWGQSAGRITESFAHARPFWWYLALMPVLTLPLCLWPGLWRAAARLKDLRGDGGLRLCAVWFGTAFILFSLISGKQLHYLLPEFPAFALIAARALAAAPNDGRRRDHLLPAIVLAIIGLALALIAGGVIPVLPPEWRGLTDPVGGAMLVGLGIGAAIVPITRRFGRIGLYAVMTAALVLVFDLTARPLLAQAFTLEPLARRLADWQAEGLPLANYGKYHGQYQFLGRLTRPVAIIGDKEARDWMAANPNGKIITYQEEDQPPDAQPDAVQPFRKHLITVWDVAKVKDNPDLVKRPQE